MKNKIHFRKFGAGVAWFALMSFLFFLPGKDVPSIGWAERLHLDKIVHFSLFFGLVFLFFWPVLRSDLPGNKKWKWLFVISGIAVFYGIFTEVVQHYFIPGRTFDIWDWAADSTGVVASIVAISVRLKKYF